MSPVTEKYAVGVLGALIAGEIGALLAARKPASLRHTLVGEKFDENWRTFIASVRL